MIRWFLGDFWGGYTSLEFKREIWVISVYWDLNSLKVVVGVGERYCFEMGCILRREYSWVRVMVFSGVVVLGRGFSSLIVGEEFSR